jgi:phytoene dehydrogenase-like protein
MRERQMIIMGAGLGGLATGCYGQMNGYRTQIFEMHSLPGGLCTSWRRNGYTFDGCIHHLAGCQMDHKLYRVWEELGAMPRPVLYSQELVQAEDAAGNRLTVYTDLDRLAQHMKELAPEDARVIDELVHAARRLHRFDPLDLAVATPWEMVKALPVLVPGLKWMKETMADAALRFQHPFLRRAFPALQYDSPANPVATFLNLLAQCETRNFGWPKGGSLAFAQDIARRYLALGGQIHYKARVERILVEEDRAVGVRLADGSEHRADVVVSNGYGPATVMNLLQGRYADERLRALYAAPVDEIGMGVLVSLGVARDLSQEPRAMVLLLDQPVTAGGRTYDRLYLELFGLDPSMAPPGKGTLKVELATSYSYWQGLHRDRERYNAEKQQLAETVVEQLEPRFPGLKGQIEVVDVATPMTTERYTGNAQPVQGGLNIHVLDMLTGKSHVRMLPGLAGFYMVGQSAGLPGLPAVAGMGRGLIQHLCRQDGKRFVVQDPYQRRSECRTTCGVS